jgi:hypothetical protein
LKLKVKEHIVDFIGGGVQDRTTDLRVVNPSKPQSLRILAALSSRIAVGFSGRNWVGLCCGVAGTGFCLEFRECHQFHEFA